MCVHACVYVCMCVCVCVCTVWLAASVPPCIWDQNEMARSCQKRFEKFNIDERRWYQLAQDRSGWRRNYRTGLEDVTEARVAEDERRRRTRVEDSTENSDSSTATDKPYQCSVCERTFRRKQDIDRHMCHHSSETVITVI